MTDEQQDKAIADAEANVNRLYAEFVDAKNRRDLIETEIIAAKRRYENAKVVVNSTSMAYNEALVLYYKIKDKS